MTEEKYDLHPQISNNMLDGYLLYIYDGKEGQRFWETEVLPGGQNIRELVPNIEQIFDIGGGAKHRRNWAHKFSIKIKK